MLNMDLTINEGSCFSEYITEDGECLLRIELVDEDGEETAHLFSLDTLTEFLAELSERRDVLEDMS